MGSCNLVSGMFQICFIALLTKAQYVHGSVDSPGVA